MLSKGVTTMGRLADKNILITGGNSGIGLATAQEFDREGARVAICGLNERTLQAAKGTLGAGGIAVRADVSKLADLDPMFATIKREIGHMADLYVNAGYSVFLPFDEDAMQRFDCVMGSSGSSYMRCGGRSSRRNGRGGLGLWAVGRLRLVAGRRFPLRQRTAWTANPGHARKLSAKTFLPSAVVDLSWKIVGYAADEVRTGQDKEIT